MQGGREGSKLRINIVEMGIKTGGSWEDRDPERRAGGGDSGQSPATGDPNEGLIIC